MEQYPTETALGKGERCPVMGMFLIFGGQTTIQR